MDNFEELKQLLKENLEVSKKIYAGTQKITNYFFWTRILRLVKWIIIIGLAVAGFIYSKPYLEQLFKLYKNIFQIISLQNFSGNVSDEQNLNPELIKQLQDVLKTIR